MRLGGSDSYGLILVPWKPDKVIKQLLNITSHNKYMGGVDKADQLRSYYQQRTKSRKFYM